MSLLSEVEALLADEDLGVRREAIYLLYLRAGDNRAGLLEDFLNHSDPRLQTAAIACLAEHKIPEAQELITEDRLETFLVRTDADAETGRMEAAALLGVLSGEHYRVFLAQLMADESPAVVREAIAAVGRQRDHNFVSTVLEKLADRRYRSAAKLALANFGIAILPVLDATLRDNTAPEVLRRNIPSVLHRIVHQQSVNLLLNAFTAVPPELRPYVARGLNKLRNQSRRLRFDRAAVNRLLFDEVRRYLLLLEMELVLTEQADAAAEKLCLRAIVEERAGSLETIFRLLGLQYPSQDIHNAYFGITSERRELKASAAEYLSNVLVGPAHAMLLPLLEGHSPRRILELASATYVRHMKSLPDVYKVMLEGSSTWLRACALNAARTRPYDGLRESVRSAIFDSSAIVRETALAVAGALGYR